jgi:hypothetical protein
MPEAELLAIGEGEYRLHDRRDLVDKTTIAADAVGRPVADGDDVSFGSSPFPRGAPVIARESIRERRRNLWFRARFPLRGSTLLVAPGACSNPPSACEIEIVRDQFDPRRTVIERTAKI